MCTCMELDGCGVGVFTMCSTFSSSAIGVCSVSCVAGLPHFSTGHYSECTRQFLLHCEFIRHLLHTLYLPPSPLPPSLPPSPPLPLSLSLSIPFTPSLSLTHTISLPPPPLSSQADHFFLPPLNLLADKLRLPPIIAAVTLLAVGKGESVFYATKIALFRKFAITLFTTCDYSCDLSSSYFRCP